MATATSRSSRSTRPARAPIDWGAGDGLAVGAPVFGVAAHVRWRGSGHVRARVGRLPRVPRAGRPADRRAASSTPLPWRRARPAARSSTPSGKFVGLNTNRIGEGFYLALPADAALAARVDALGRGESPKRLRLGVAIAPSHVARRLRRSVGLAERDGILVRGVEEGSLAEAAGVEAGDLIVSAGGKPIGDADDLFDALGEPRAAVRARDRARRGGADRDRAAPAAGGEKSGRTPGDA